MVTPPGVFSTEQCREIKPGNQSQCHQLGSSHFRPAQPIGLMVSLMTSLRKIGDFSNDNVIFSIIDAPVHFISVQSNCDGINQEGLMGDMPMPPRRPATSRYTAFMTPPEAVTSSL